MSGLPAVLVIDHSAEVRTVIRALLTKKGFDTVEAPDPPSAVEALKNGTFAMILLDIKMPHDGVALLDYIGQSLPHLLPKLIIFLPFIDQNVCAVLPKPLDIEQLSRAILTCGAAR